MNVEGTLFDFPTSDGVTLEAFLVGSARAKSCIVYVHGMRGNFYSSALGAVLCETATKQGYKFCSINTRGHDILSRVITTKGKQVVGTAVERFEWCVPDIAGALTALKKRGLCSFVLVGHSTGCQKITYYQYKKKDRAVKALVLLAPVDDYNYEKRRVGPRWTQAVRKARRLGDDPMPHEEFNGFSAKRFLSIANPKNIEARLFNYDGPLREFASIRTPILSIFGKQEECAVMPVDEYLRILTQRSESEQFNSTLLRGNHSFTGQESIVARRVLAWLDTIEAHSR